MKYLISVSKKKNHILFGAVSLPLTVTQEVPSQFWSPKLKEPIFCIKLPVLFQKKKNICRTINDKTFLTVLVREEFGTDFLSFLGAFTGSFISCYKHKNRKKKKRIFKNNININICNVLCSAGGGRLQNIFMYMKSSVLHRLLRIILPVC